MGEQTNTEQSDIPTSIWDQAIKEVDGERGYTLEFAPDPAEHRAAWYEQIAANVAGEL